MYTDILIAAYGTPFHGMCLSRSFAKSFAYSFLGKPLTALFQGGERYRVISFREERNLSNRSQGRIIATCEPIEAVYLAPTRRNTDELPVCEVK